MNGIQKHNINSPLRDEGREENNRPGCEANTEDFAVAHSPSKHQGVAWGELRVRGACVSTQMRTASVSHGPSAGNDDRETGIGVQGAVGWPRRIGRTHGFRSAMRNSLGCRLPPFGDPNTPHPVLGIRG